LRRYGRVRRGWIGVSIQDLDPDLSRYFKVPRGEGVLITRVHAKSPSAEAGLRPGDVILSLGGLALRRSEDFGRALERAPIGAPTALEVFRGGKRWKVSVSVRELRDAQRTPVTPPKPARMRHPPIGVELRPLTSDLAERLGLEDPAGLLVFVVDPGSPADRAGMRRGDVIRSVGLQAVRTRQGLQGILRELKSPEVLVLLQRGDQRFFTLLNLASPSKSARNPGF
ncbi:MAG: PDZ domain-containing protein, partial [Nitrospinota bacterium]